MVRSPRVCWEMVREEVPSRPRPLRGFGQGYGLTPDMETSASLQTRKKISNFPSQGEILRLRTLNSWKTSSLLSSLPWPLHVSWRACLRGHDPLPGTLVSPDPSGSKSMVPHTQARQIHASRPGSPLLAACDGLTNVRCSYDLGRHAPPRSVDALDGSELGRGLEPDRRPLQAAQPHTLAPRQPKPAAELTPSCQRQHFQGGIG